MTVRRCADCGTVLGELHPGHSGDTLCRSCHVRRPGPRVDERIAEAPRAEANPAGDRELAERYAGRRYDHARLTAEAATDRHWRVHEFAMDGHLTILAAASGEGKTWMALLLGAATSQGASAGGLACDQGRVVIFDAENGPYVLGSRLALAGVPAEVAIYDAEGLRLGDDADRAWMLDVIREEKAALVFIDALKPLAPDAKENDADDMSPLILAAKRLARESGAAVVLFHHRGEDPTKAFRGSTAIRDGCDMLFVLERAKDDPERRWRRRLWTDKCRVAEEPEDRWLELRVWRGEMTLRQAEPFEPGMGAAAPKRDELMDRALDLLDESGRWMGLAKIGRELNLPNPKATTLRRALEGLVDDGRIEREPDGDHRYRGGCQPPRGTPGTPPAAGMGANGGSPYVVGAPDGTPGAIPPTPVAGDGLRASTAGAYDGADDPQSGSSVPPEQFDHMRGPES